MSRHPSDRHPRPRDPLTRDEDFTPLDLTATDDPFRRTASPSVRDDLPKIAPVTTVRPPEEPIPTDETELPISSRAVGIRDIETEAPSHASSTGRPRENPTTSTRPVDSPSVELTISPRPSHEPLPHRADGDRPTRSRPVTFTHRPRPTMETRPDVAQFEPFLGPSVVLADDVPTERSPSPPVLEPSPRVAVDDVDTADDPSDKPRLETEDRLDDLEARIQRRLDRLEQQLLRRIEDETARALFFQQALT